MPPMGETPLGYVPLIEDASQERLLVLDVPFSPPSERGRVHGEKLSSTIATLFEAWTGPINGVKPRCPKDAALAYARKCWPVIQSAAPESAEEILALAQASGVDLYAIVALNCFDEIGLVDAIETGKGENLYSEIGERGGHPPPASLQGTGGRGAGHCTGVAVARADGRAVTGQTVLPALDHPPNP